MSVLRNVKNIVKNFSDAEVKVREATSNDPWGPTTNQMSELCDLTFNEPEINQIMDMLFNRLNDHGKNWRHVYKSLTVIQYILINGSDVVFKHIKNHVYLIQTLREFQYNERDGKDSGASVREKSKQVIRLLTDEEYLKEEKEKSETARSRICPKNSYIKQSNYSSVWTAPEKRAEMDSLSEYINESRHSSRQFSDNKKSITLKASKSKEEADLKVAIELSLIEEEQRQRISKIENDQLSKAIDESKKLKMKNNALICNSNFYLDPFSIPSRNQFQENNQVFSSNEVVFSNVHKQYPSSNNNSNCSKQSNTLEDMLFDIKFNNAHNVNQQPHNKINNFDSYLTPLDFTNVKSNQNQTNSTQELSEDTSKQNFETDNKNKSQLLDLYKEKINLVNIDHLASNPMQSSFNYQSKNPFDVQNKPVSLNEIRATKQQNNMSNDRLF